MGSSILLIIANIFEKQFKREILDNASLKPFTWFRYMNDTFVISQSEVMGNFVSIPHFYQLPIPQHPVHNEGRTK